MPVAMFATVSAFLVVAVAVAQVAADDPRLDRYKYVTTSTEPETRYDPQENDVWYWRTQAQEALNEKMNVRPIEGVAKNVILFLGDGMSIPTLTAARIYMGQLTNQSGEASRFSFERFPYTGLSKTYCVDKQVADSACSSTAYLGGVKANYGTLGVTASVRRGNCTRSLDTHTHVDTILSWAQAAGKATGLVTTTRITHASPAGHYAHTADRDWESDYDMLTKDFKADPTVCQDVASQLVHNLPGRDCKVLLGGGRAKFIPVNALGGGEGERQDGQSLIKDWKEDKKNRGRAEYVADRRQLLNVDVHNTDYLMGLFNADHMKYHLEEDNEDQPTLAEMTEVAIKMLQKEKKGFYLFVEGGKIDLAHHQNYVQRALDETVELHKAVQMAVSLVDIHDTLVIVTADHAHTMSMAGYPLRGDNILGAHSLGNDSLPYTTLSYANGPSAEVNRTGLRRDITEDDLDNVSYRFPALNPLLEETHGGDDVAVYARGPMAHLLVGNYEQTLIPHVMAYAARIGPAYASLRVLAPSSSVLHTPAFFFILAALVVLRRLQ